MRTSPSIQAGPSFVSSGEESAGYIQAPLISSFSLPEKRDPIDEQPFFNEISHYSTGPMIVMHTFDFTKNFNSLNGHTMVVLINHEILIIVYERVVDLKSEIWMAVFKIACLTKRTASELVVFCQQNRWFWQAAFPRRLLQNPGQVNLAMTWKLDARKKFAT